MIVLGLLGFLFGLGVGFLRSTASAGDLALSIVRDRARAASLAARRRGLPTQMVVEPAGEVLTRVRARVLYPVGDWHFEEGERPRTSLLAAEVTGESVPGRFGRGLRVPYDDRGDRPLFRLETGGSSLFRFEDGFALRFDVKLAALDPGPMARLGDGLAVELEVDEFGVGFVVARLVTTRDGQRGPVAVLRDRAPLPSTWASIEVFHDGRNVGLRVGRRAPVVEPVLGPLYQQASDALEIGLANSPFPGVLDEVRLLAYELDPGETLPEEARLIDLPRAIAFDELGETAEEVSFAIQVGDEEPERHTIRRTGVVE
jgi:hypothetical protein